MKDLAEKVVFITGGASGIGLALARACGEQGMRVMLADIDREALDSAVVQLSNEQIDVDGVISYALFHGPKFPFLTEASFGTSDLSVNVALLDVDAGPDLRLRQDFELEANPLQVTLEFFDEDFNPLDIGLTEVGGALETASTWTGNCLK